MKKSQDTSSTDAAATKDQLYAQPREAITQFVFDDSVVSVFEDMIGRSVPGYSTLLSMFPVISRDYVKAGSRCYDLGCSLGAATLAMQRGIDQPDVQIIAVDNSPSMIDECTALIATHASNVDIKIKLADINNVKVSNASMVMMNFTLQFIAQPERYELLDKIYRGMNAGGVFILSEKIKSNEVSQNKRLIELHHAFKRANGYSDLEISQKRTALENVLIPETVEQHLKRLQQIGFSESLVWFQCFNFVSIMAIK